MLIFKFTYIFLKTVLFDRIGICWNNKHLVSLKDVYNKKCLRLFQKHENSSFDEFVVDFRVIVWVITGFVFLEFVLLNTIVRNKSSLLIHQMAITVVITMYLSIYGFITNDKIKAIVRSIGNDFLKGIKIVGVILLIVFACILAVNNYSATIIFPYNNTIIFKKGNTFLSRTHCSA